MRLPLRLHIPFPCRLLPLGQHISPSTSTPEALSGLMRIREIHHWSYYAHTHTPPPPNPSSPLPCLSLDQYFLSLKLPFSRAGPLYMQLSPWMRIMHPGLMVLGAEPTDSGAFEMLRQASIGLAGTSAPGKSWTIVSSGNTAATVPSSLSGTSPAKITVSKAET